MGRTMVYWAVAFAAIPAGMALATLVMAWGPNPQQADMAVQAISQAFGSGDFAPHIYCLAGDEGLIGLTVMGDVLISISYKLIPIGLIFIAFDLVRGSYGWNDLMPQVVSFWFLFALFVLLCGFGHDIKVVNLFAANYWLEAYWSLTTGLISLITVVAIAIARRATLEDVAARGRRYSDPRHALDAAIADLRR